MKKVTLRFDSFANFTSLTIVILRLVCYMLFLMLFSACATGDLGRNTSRPNDFTTYSDSIVSNADKLRISCVHYDVEYKKVLAEYLLTLDKTRLSTLLSITENINDNARRSTSIASEQRYYPHGLAGLRYTVSQFASQECSKKACEILLQTADLFAKDDDKTVAKRLYRDVITIYTGPLYKSYVKKAEFGLEDLRQ
jgi:hypothetical protein